MLVVDLTPLVNYPSANINGWPRLERVFSEFMETNYGVLFIMPTDPRALGARFLNRAFHVSV